MLKDMNDVGLRKFLLLLIPRVLRLLRELGGGDELRHDLRPSSACLADDILLLRTSGRGERERREKRERRERERERENFEEQEEDARPAIKKYFFEYANAAAAVTTDAVNGSFCLFPNCGICSLEPGQANDDDTDNEDGCVVVVDVAASVEGLL